MADYTWLTQVDGTYPPPGGRSRLSLAEAEALLVHSPAFADSKTRSDLWSGLERYLATFYRLEEKYAAELNESLLRLLWLGGSFVSGRLDPENIDLTVFVDDASRALVKGRPGAPWLTRAFDRSHTLSEYGLSPLEVRYRPVVSVFRNRLVSQADKDYLIARGGWDDWWQRLRNTEDEAPSLDTVATRRGYLEVTL